MARETMSDDDASEEQLDEETKRFMYDRFQDIGGLPDQPVDDCVRDVVVEMRNSHPREYDISTERLIDVAYDIAAEAVKARKTGDRSREIVAEVEGDA